MKSSVTLKADIDKNHFYSDITNDDLFWKIFKSNQLAIAFTDQEGKIERSNDLFTTLVCDVPVPAKLGELLRANPEKLFSDGIHCLLGTNTVRLSCIKVAEQPSLAPAYLWLAKQELHAMKPSEDESILQLKNDQLAKVNHQMEKFLYSTSHDLRSPLTTILGLVNLVRMECREQYVLDYIAKIEYSTLKLDKIIRDIMSFSRTTYQRIASEKIMFEALVWKSINAYPNDPATRQISFEVKVQQATPFYSDAERLIIIIENIIRNSIHFYDSSKVKPFIQVNVKVDDTQVMLEFIDNGIGIGQQHLSQIFNLFYKASHLSKGAGLGLYIVKETIEKLKGTISVESEIGFGTVLRVVIPNDHKGKLIGRKLQLVNAKR